MWRTGFGGGKEPEHKQGKRPNSCKGHFPEKLRTHVARAETKESSMSSAEDQVAGLGKEELQSLWWCGVWPRWWGARDEFGQVDRQGCHLLSCRVLLLVIPARKR